MNVWCLKLGRCSDENLEPLQGLESVILFIIYASAAVALCEHHSLYPLTVSLGVISFFFVPLQAPVYCCKRCVFWCRGRPSRMLASFSSMNRAPRGSLQAHLLLNWKLLITHYNWMAWADVLLREQRAGLLKRLQWRTGNLWSSSVCLTATHQLPAASLAYSEPSRIHRECCMFGSIKKV